MQVRAWLYAVGVFAAEVSLTTLAFLAIGGTAAVFVHAERGTAVVASLPSSPIVLPKTLGSSEAPLALERQGRSAALGRRDDPLPPFVLHNVPFSSQAPFGDWRTPYDEACEETSVVMAMAWVMGKNVLAPGDADEAIRWLVAYETYYFGYHQDTAVRETLKLITHSYRYPFARIELASRDAIRRELASGNLVILPVAGELLANSYYAKPPPYHMVVAVGYDDRAAEFIVNDPGTKYGKNFRYSYGVIEGAIHDWTGSDETVELGAKRMIVVERPSAS